MKGMWVGYDVGCTMGLTCGHGAWQIDRQSSGSMWNSYSFQPVGQWMSYSFTDLAAEGCCRSLNALFDMISTNSIDLLSFWSYKHGIKWKKTLDWLTSYIISSNLVHPALHVMVIIFFYAFYAYFTPVSCISMRFYQNRVICGTSWR